MRICYFVITNGYDCVAFMVLLESRPITDDAGLREPNEGCCYCWQHQILNTNIVCIYGVLSFAGMQNMIENIKVRLHKVSTTLFCLTSCAGLCFYNVRRKRVAHRANSLHTGALPTVRGEGQRLNSHHSITVNLFRLIKKLMDGIYSVVEISRTARNTQL